MEKFSLKFNDFKTNYESLKDWRWKTLEKYMPNLKTMSVEKFLAMKKAEVKATMARNSHFNDQTRPNLTKQNVKIGKAFDNPYTMEDQEPMRIRKETSDSSLNTDILEEIQRDDKMMGYRHDNEEESLEIIDVPTNIHQTPYGDGDDAVGNFYKTAEHQNQY